MIPMKQYYMISILTKIKQQKNKNIKLENPGIDPGASRMQIERSSI